MLAGCREGKIEIVKKRPFCPRFPVHGLLIWPLHWLHLIRYTFVCEIAHSGGPCATENPARLLSHQSRKRTGPEMAAALTSRGASSYREKPATCEVALARRHAVMPSAWPGIVGGPHGPADRTARVILCVYREHLVALHGFIKKTRTTPQDDLTLARQRQKELER